MTSNVFDADRVLLVHLRSYGFFHSGRERLVVQVLKRTWEHIPGGTVYGALAAALLRLEPVNLAAESLDIDNGQGGYFDLLRAVRAGQIRFTPLLPAASPLTSGQAYCQQAMRLARPGPLTDEGETRAARLASQLYHTSPHAPLARATEQIYGDQLFALRTHQPQLDYYGFIFTRAEHCPWLEKGLSYFPCMPFGGRGKFSLVEAAVVGEQPLDDFSRALQAWAEERGGWVRLLTPLVLPRTGIAEPLANGVVEEIIMTGLQRYRVWRTGIYFNGQEFDQPVGVGPYYGGDDAPLQAGGAESVAVQAVPERSRFRLPQNDLASAVRWFIQGAGHLGWRYLGWGQVVIE
jgi:hypothetical protein